LTSREMWDNKEVNTKLGKKRDKDESVISHVVVKRGFRKCT